MTAVAAAPHLADVGHLPAIGLDELQETAALQTRVDRKYVLPLAAVPDLVAALPAGARRLVIGDRDAFGYESVYFDTPGLDAFHLAAGRRRRRYKVRTRTYTDTGGCWLEVKTRGPRGTTVKDRREHDVRERAEVGDALGFVVDTLRAHGVHLPDAAAGDELLLAPTLTTQYHRRTLYLPDGARLTVDTGLEWIGARSAAAVPEHAVVETKSVGGASVADRALWALGHRPSRISKYATGLVVLDPALGGRPWRRTLRRSLAV
ncbi:polyphosphate polymerase domain-containing protein [Cellulomonas sp. ACRRI]|uniref:polyphosphate polymerase domain-containing protein n=1 Tax=Cellulomonas sp. ACRRI TaxID=2918188 RepID=UPI001EF1D470|nr:polyphosphate polymerase domain-containing protein [Cellulomonas sp. ACRRI]MCG7284363.1 polyphosphate polymerase domain-containing protein [Cellulomonas sp. ACRRI]